MSPFKKVKNFDSTANVLSYAYFQVCTGLSYWITTVVTCGSTLSTCQPYNLWNKLFLEFCHPSNTTPLKPLKYNTSNFQAFKFPDSMNVHFQCVVQVMNNCHGSAF